MSHRIITSPFLSLIILLLIMLLILVACGDTSTPPPPAPGDATEDSSESTPPADDVDDSAPPSDESADHAMLRIGMSEWPEVLDPQQAGFTNENAVLSLIYEGLTRIDDDLQVVPGAAESWEYNDDETEITFTLRPDLTYSDGSPLTSQDFADALRRSIDPRRFRDYQARLGVIKGADAIFDADPDDPTLDKLLDDLGIATPDDRTIIITFSVPAPYFHILASTPITFPAKHDLVEDGGELWYEDPNNHIGNGPFIVTIIDRDRNLLFVPNPTYWQGAPSLDEVRIEIVDDSTVALREYQIDKLDIIRPDPADIPAIKTSDLKDEYYEYSAACVESYELNLTMPPFDDQKVREAFAYAYDRDSMLADILPNSAEKGLTWIAPGFDGHDETETRYDFDPERARELLAEAGYPNGEGLPPVTLTYAGGDPKNEAAASYIVQMYREQLGVTITPEPLDWGALSELLEDVDTHPQMVVSAWCPDYPDPKAWLTDYWHSQSGLAMSFGYANEEVDRLLEEADIEKDDQRRLELYQEAQRLIIGDAPQIIRSYTVNNYLVKPRVRGLVTTPMDTEFPAQLSSLMNVTIEE